MAKMLSGREYLDEIDALVLAGTNSVVMQGPFRGAHYISTSNNSALAPRLLGTYEKELNPYIEQIIATPYTRVIDIGCAEGYYAVGIARLMSGMKVNAYDVDEDATIT